MPNVHIVVKQALNALKMFDHFVDTRRYNNAIKQK